ncbi:MAG: type I DNA topoisomerase [Patescibacteria group bacterium]
MNLVIVESPSKSKTLEKYLGKEYKVVASMGHIRDLPKSKLGVDVENNFTESYEISPSKKKTVSALTKLVKSAKAIYLATDPDREGEAIAWHLAQVFSEDGLVRRHEKLGATPPPVQVPPKGTGAFLRRRSAPLFQRVSFNEITKDAVLSAFEHPREIDTFLVDAQRARRVLDRLVGYKLSPLLWKKIRYGLSAGRVQSPAVRFLVERQKEIDAFKSERFYEVETLLQENNVLNTSEAAPKGTPRTVGGGGVLNAKLTHINGVPIYTKRKYPLFAGEYTVSQTTINNENKLSEIKTELPLAEYKIDSIEEKEYQKAPKPPFTTSSLQQEASWKLGFSPKKTMSLAQKLYEAGLITYMRTDSTNLSSSSLSAIRGFIAEKYGKEYLPKEPRFYKTKVKVAQEAHEAIRPTDVKVKTSTKMEGDALRLYEIVWQKTVACQMTNAVYSGVTVKISALKGSNNYTLLVKDSVLKFSGWMAVSNRRDSSPETASDIPSNMTIGKQLHFVSLDALEKQTPPPSFYNEASLIKELEKFGIGRPSTYAPIVSTIQDRGYTQKIEGKLKPTDSGIVVTKLLTDNFAEIVDVNFTAKMENELDEVANHHKEYLSVIKEFYDPFEKLLNEKQDAIKKSDYTVLETMEEKCPKCSSPLIVKLGKYGRFVSCSDYPKCDYLRPIIEKTGIKCPKCKDGDIIVRKTKKGKTFYGCSAYPKCDFAVWKLDVLS